jgi:hypothetical protein
MAAGPFAVEERLFQRGGVEECSPLRTSFDRIR